MVSQNTIPLRMMLRAFPGIPVKEAQELVASGEVHTYPENTILCHEDLYETIFYILLDGRVKVTKMVSSTRNEVRELQTLEAGDFFGEMALLQNAPRAATVTSVTPVSVLEVHKEYFNDLLRTSASLSRAMIQEVVRRLRQNDAMAIEDLRLKAGELANAYQQLAEQEYARREFITTIAHELRTPLTAAQGFLQMIETGLEQGYNLDSEMQQNAIRTASRNVQQIVALVNDILFIQEMDLILPSFEPIDLGALLRQVADQSQARLVDNQVSLYLNIPASLSKISGDAKSLGRALDAVLDNAIKYSYGGGQVEVSAVENRGKIRVEVHDHGVGIAEDVLPHVFDRFFHLDQIDGRFYRGAGLGLSIARQVIEQHNGKVQITSKPREGTTVTIIL